MCIRLENKLKQKNIKFTIVDDETEILNAGINDLPALKYDGKIYHLKDAIKLIEEM